MELTRRMSRGRGRSKLFGKRKRGDGKQFI